MICPACQKEIPEGEVLCAACGEQLKGEGSRITKLLPRIFLRRRDEKEPAPGKEGSRQLALTVKGRPPLRLTPVRVVTIGRHPDNDIVLGTDGVSRRHARIEFREPYYIIVDLQSANGTRLNGEMVIEAPLLAGSEIQIHDHLIKVETVEPQPDAAEEGHTLIVTSESRWRGQQMALQGSLDQVPLLDVCAMLKASKRTGTLYLEQGRVHVLEGRIIHAEAAELSSVEAFIHLAQQTEGEFQFRAGLPVLQRSIDESTTTLLRNAAATLGR